MRLPLLALPLAASLALSLALAPPPALAEPPVLDLPVACVLGETCHLQQFPDRDPGPGARDFTCGPLSYDGHKGTDVALASEADMRAGVAVLAAAGGVVKAVRDGMADAAQGDVGAPDITDRECGNGVVIDHGAGWETQYCHMARGSLRVARGEPVGAGDPLGLIGLSGKTDFPHLHLLVRHRGQIIDPFDTGETDACGGSGKSLWREPPAYAAGAILGLGWADAVPEYAAIKAGTADDRDIAPGDKALVLWVFAYGGREGDVIRLRFDGPGDADFAADAVLDRNQARFFRAGGRRTPEGGWPAGRYAGTADMIRGGALIDSAAAAIDIAP